MKIFRTGRERGKFQVLLIFKKLIFWLPFGRGGLPDTLKKTKTFKFNGLVQK